MHKTITIITIIVGLGLVVLYNAMFIVSQTQQALVVQFGDIRHVVKEPGLNFKVPFIQNVIYFDNRLLEMNAQPAEFITKDRNANVEERVVIDAFVRYRITNPVQFFKRYAMKQGSIAGLIPLW